MTSQIFFIKMGCFTETCDRTDIARGKIKWIHYFKFYEPILEANSSSWTNRTWSIRPWIIFNFGCEYELGNRWEDTGYWKYRMILFYFYFKNSRDTRWVSNGYLSSVMRKKNNMRHFEKNGCLVFQNGLAERRIWECLSKT